MSQPFTCRSTQLDSETASRPSLLDLWAACDSLPWAADLATVLPWAGNLMPPGRDEAIDQLPELSDYRQLEKLAEQAGCPAPSLQPCGESQATASPLSPGYVPDLLAHLLGREAKFRQVKRLPRPSLGGQSQPRGQRAYYELAEAARAIEDNYRVRWRGYVGLRHLRHAIKNWYVDIC